MSVDPEKSGIHDAPRQGSHVDVEELKAHNVMHSEVLVDKDLMATAYEGENREHEMGVWEAAKSHPMACFWAFTMSFTIVWFATSYLWKYLFAVFRTAAGMLRRQS